MSHHLGSLAAVSAAAIIAHTGALAAASGSISGTVKISVAASNANALVYIQEVPGTFPPGTSIEMNQRGLQFIPHVLPIISGTTVTFLNGDATPHNVFSPDYEKYDLGTWPQGQTKEYTFPECAKPPCVYAQLCKIHVEMIAYVAVLQNPYFAVTDKQGHYEIGNVPPGSYALAVWYAGRSKRYTAQPKAVTVDAGAPVTVDFIVNR
jgi:plastocyanin